MLKSLVMSPPGGWRYIQPDTKLTFSGERYDQVYMKVREHREYKKLDRSTLIEVMDDVEQYIIKEIDYDPNYCTHENLTNGKRDGR